jgi:toxin-antitoxin system PIN domain toxin
VSCSLDVNILLYASQPESPVHEPARRLLEELSGGPELLCLTWQTLSGYLRIATSTRIFPNPLSAEEATANVTALLARSRTRLIAEEVGFWELYRDLLTDARARGDLVADVHLAALLRQHGVRTLYTRDRDFRRFDFLDVRDPFAA